MEESSNVDTSYKKKFMLLGVEKKHGNDAMQVSRAAHSEVPNTRRNWNGEMCCFSGTLVANHSTILNDVL